MMLFGNPPCLYVFIFNLITDFGDVFLLMHPLPTWQVNLICLFLGVLNCYGGWGTAFFCNIAFSPKSYTYLKNNEIY